MTLIALAVTGCGSSEDLELHQSEKIGDWEGDEFLVDTYHAPGPIRLPIWQVVQRKEPVDEVIFTVERVWQESDPGYPRMKVMDVNQVIADASSSFIFSIRDGRFVKNDFPARVYLGRYRAPPIQNKSRE